MLAPEIRVNTRREDRVNRDEGPEPTIDSRQRGSFMLFSVHQKARYHISIHAHLAIQF